MRYKAHRKQSIPNHNLGRDSLEYTQETSCGHEGIHFGKN